MLKVLSKGLEAGRRSFDKERNSQSPKEERLPGLNLGLVVPLNHLGREVLQTQGSGQGGAHGIQVGTESVRLYAEKIRKKLKKMKKK